MKKPELSIVIPLYNEEANVARLAEQLTNVLQKLETSNEIVWVDDGSKDGTLDVLRQLSRSHDAMRVISLSRNFGHQIALIAGLEHARGGYVLSMDGDLQHPPSLIPAFCDKIREGYDIVNSVRLDTEGIGLFKRMSSTMFYSLINSFSDVPIQEGSADFRMFNRKALDAFLRYGERTRFNRGLVSLMGFRQTNLYYQAEARFAGQSKYTYRKMVRFAIDGILSFSSRPLRVSFYVGLLVFMMSGVYTSYAIWQHWRGQTVEGWTSILISVLCLGAV